ncbi:MAG TPA: DUF3426 domain-containing protein [Woeseiaceae bacterium]|nr:DUF3426 domain-containing protein [Woeseiaceae bacterium]
MFTHCPECRASFRVTAAVLQQAAGRVRCGGCGHAFNALERLSETVPGTGGGRSLLDDFDALSATDNVRIEDTGVEWQVVEDEEPANAHPQESLELVNEPESAEERYDDNTPLPEVLDDDEVAQAPAPPRRRAEDLLEPRSPELDERQVDLALSEPEDWTDLLAEVGADGTPGAAEHAAEAGELSLVEEEPARDVQEESPREVEEEPALGVDEESPLELAEESPVEPAEESPLELDEEPALHGQEDPALGVQDASPLERQEKPLLETEEQPTLGAEDEPPSEINEPTASGAGGGGHYVPPPTDEEVTLNRLIDQDLLRLSEEQQDLAATTARELAAETAPHVETIIMEGAFVRSSLEADEVEANDAGTAADAAAGAADTTEEILDLRDTYVRTRDSARAGRRPDGAARYAAVAGVAALALLLVAQVVHAYRETLATYGVLGDSLISIYAAAGAPITPDWDVNGWQFQETRGSTAAADTVLTISWTLANISEQALPYPLLHVALTDRYEEIIASQLLQAGQYLEIRAADGRIAPGGKLKASVTIAPLSPEAAGFKLNVCYPLSAEEVRCATGAFKER